MLPPALKLLSSMATRGLLDELSAAYTRASGRTTLAEAAGGVDVAKRVQAGEGMDVVVLANNAIDALMAGGTLLEGSRADLVRSGVAIAVRRGAVQPRIGTEAEVKDSVLSARSVSYSTGPSGVYLEKLFERWGILESVRSRIVVAPPGVAVGALLADGRVELGFQQLSELQHLSGVDVVGPLPAEIQVITVFAGAVATRSDDPDGARSLLSFMASPAAAAAKRRHGMEPAA